MYIYLFKTADNLQVADHVIFENKLQEHFQNITKCLSTQAFSKIIVTT